MNKIKKIKLCFENGHEEEVSLHNETIFTEIFGIKNIESKSGEIRHIRTGNNAKILLSTIGMLNCQDLMNRFTTIINNESSI